MKEDSFGESNTTACGSRKLRVEKFFSFRFLFFSCPLGRLYTPMSIVTNKVIHSLAIFDYGCIISNMNKNQSTIYQSDEAMQIVNDFVGLEQTDNTTRNAVFSKYEKFVLDGDQWLDADKPDGDKPCLTFNQCEDFINTFKSKLFPRNMSTGTLAVGVKVYNEEKEKKEVQEKKIIDAYSRNKLSQIILEQAQNFLVGGSACLYYPQDPVTKLTKVLSLDPCTIYLGWNGSELEQFAFEDEISIADAEQNKSQSWIVSAIKNFFSNETPATRKFKKTKRITYWDNYCQVITVGNTVKVTKNEAGFIPFSWIPNEPKAHRHEGISEAKKLYDLEIEFNKRASDFAQRVKTNTKPTLATFTDADVSKLDGEKLEGILPLAPGDRAEFLKLTENKELLDYLNMLGQKMAGKMGINEAVQGAVKSNVSSLAMIYYFSPLMDKIGLKRVFWDQAFRELNRAILYYEAGVEDAKTDPIYEPVILTDLKTKIENTVLMLTNNLISHEDAIDELRGSENAVEKVKGILEDMKEFGIAKPVAQPKITPTVPQIMA